VGYFLGNGREVAAHDTVPFTIWAVARHLDDYEQAIWTTAAADGDIDTTCAIVGGIAGAGAGPGGIPEAWLRAAEPRSPGGSAPHSAARPSPSP
jgi:ADP-ribosylglycohydrolase